MQQYKCQLKPKPQSCVIKDLRLASTRDHHHPSPPTTTTVIHWDSETRQKAQLRVNHTSCISTQTRPTRKHATRVRETEKSQSPPTPAPDLRGALGGLGRSSVGFSSMELFSSAEGKPRPVHRDEDALAGQPPRTLPRSGAAVNVRPWERGFILESSGIFTPSPGASLSDARKHKFCLPTLLVRRRAAKEKKTKLLTPP